MFSILKITNFLSIIFLKDEFYFTEQIVLRKDFIYSTGINFILIKYVILREINK